MSTQKMNQKELTEMLRAASDAYYGTGASIMSDHEFDRQLEKLKEMEAESGVILSGSPTIHVGGVTVDYLEKRAHEHPALSLDKYKYEDRDMLLGYLGGRDAFLSWKMDGLTVVLTYDDGRLSYAVTRGNDGTVGNVITHNAIFFKGVPHEIPYKGHLIVRGEAVMSYTEFDRINAEGGEYENPRNLAGATVQMLDSNESRKREIRFKAFKLVVPAPDENGLQRDLSLMHNRMNWLQEMGIDTVDYVYQFAGTFYDPAGNDVSGDILSLIDVWKDRVKELPYPTDGLVITFEDQVYAESLGSTGHYSRGSMALKWTDETVSTTLRDIEWSVGKTGVITPVAIFDPVRLGAGSTVTRASLHNLSIMKNVPEVDGNHGRMLIGSRVEVGLANMIIPQVFGFHAGGENLKEIGIPDFCPVCGHPVEQHDNGGVQTLHCVNDSCSARRIGRLLNTFGKDALDVSGLGESQIIDLMEAGLVDHTPASFFRLKDRDAVDSADAYDELMRMDGWGVKKWENLLAAIEKARNTTLKRFLYGLNVQFLGNDLSKKLSAYWKGDVAKFMEFVDCAAEDPAAALEELVALDGVGEGKAMPLVEWAYTVRLGTDARKDLDNLVSCLTFDSSMYEKKETGMPSLEGMTFVITGAVHQYKNRDEFKASVEARGGRVSGSVSKKTDYLVNNDLESTTGKNKKAKELVIPIISEDEFIKKFGK